MDKFLIKRKRGDEQTSSQPEVKLSRNVGSNNVQAKSSQPEVQSPLNVRSSGEKEVNVDGLESDPALRRNIYDYDSKQIEKVRRAYLQRGPCQPKNHDFPRTLFVNGKRRFNPKWFDEHEKWLEYSIKEDAAFCLCCYLFKPKQANKRAGGESFVSVGFRNWKKKERLNEHVGGPMSSHNQCLRACDDLMNHKQHIETFFERNNLKKSLEGFIVVTEKQEEV